MGFGKWLKKNVVKPLVRIAGWTPYTGFGLLNQVLPRDWGGGTSNPAGMLANTAGVSTPAGRSEARDAQNAANASAAAQIRQAEFEASQKAGQERLAAKRRRGQSSANIVQSGLLGSGSLLGA